MAFGEPMIEYKIISSWAIQFVAQRHGYGTTLHIAIIGKDAGVNSITTIVTRVTYSAITGFGIDDNPAVQLVKILVVQLSDGCFVENQLLRQWFFFHPEDPPSLDFLLNILFFFLVFKVFKDNCIKKNSKGQEKSIFFLDTKSN